MKCMKVIRSILYHGYSVTKSRLTNLLSVIKSLHVAVLVVVRKMVATVCCD